MSSNTQEDKPKDIDNKKEKKHRPYYIGGISGFILVLLIFLMDIGFIVTIIIYLNFLIDSKTINLDKIGFTRLGKNTHFSLCSIHSCVDGWQSSFIFNSIICFVLLFQEVVVSSKWMRQTFLKRAIGDFLFYPKYVIRFITLFNFSMLHMLYQPMNFEYLEIYPKLYLEEYFHPAFLFIPLLIGLYLIFSSLYFHIVLNDELGIFLMKKIFKGEPIHRLGDYLYGYNIYFKIRSPFRAGLMLLSISINPVWDLGRLIYTLLFWFAMYVEGINDDRFYFDQYDEYKEYIKKVPCRFFDLSYLTGVNKKKNDIINDNKTKEDKKEQQQDIGSKRRRNKKKNE